jgi:hypothetical protein
MRGETANKQLPNDVQEKTTMTRHFNLIRIMLLMTAAAKIGGRAALQGRVKAEQTSRL